MPQATLTLTLPEDVWIGRLSRSYPEAQFRVLSAFANGDTGVGLLEISGSGFDAILPEMRSFDAISNLDILQTEDTRVLVQFETTFPLLLLPIQDSGVPLEMPFDIVDGEAVWELTAPQDRLSELATQLDAFGIQFTVERIHQQIESEDLLTDRQVRLVRAALDYGYYDTPRTCSLTELADATGIAKSTCSETLHRAEERIIKQFVENQLVNSTPNGTVAQPPD